MMHRRLLAVWLAAWVAALLVFSGCGTVAERGNSDAGGSGAGASDAGTAATLDFTARTADGATFDGAQFAGKPALLWFWAPWCPTCRAQARSVAQLAEVHGDELNVVGVGSLDSAAAIGDYAQQLDGFPQLVDEDGAVWRHFEVTAQSSYVLLDDSGQVVVEGYLDNAEIAAAVEELVG